MLILILFTGILLAADLAAWLLAALGKGYWPAVKPLALRPFIWLRRLALKPRGRWM